MTRKANIEDWENDAPLLASLEKINPYTVPNGYFEQLSSAIYARTSQQPQKQKIMPLWLRYAAAACITAVVGLGIFLTNKATTGDHFADIPEQEIVSYLQSNIEDTDAELLLTSMENMHLEEEKVSTTELETYVNQSL